MYRELKQTVRGVATDRIYFYFEFRSRASKDSTEPLQVASSEFSFEELDHQAIVYRNSRSSDRHAGHRPAADVDQSAGQD
jgi:hypothetical protein